MFPFYQTLSHIRIKYDARHLLVHAIHLGLMMNQV